MHEPSARSWCQRGAHAQSDDQATTDEVGGKYVASPDVYRDSRKIGLGSSPRMRLLLHPLFVVSMHQSTFRSALTFLSSGVVVSLPIIKVIRVIVLMITLVFKLELVFLIGTRSSSRLLLEIASDLNSILSQGKLRLTSSG